MKLSIQRKLQGLSLIGVVFVVVVGLVGWMSTQRLGEASSHMALTTSALRLQMQSDMMHDAVRGDVMQALVAGLLNDETQKKSLLDEFNAHAVDFEQSMKALQAQDLDADVHRALGDVWPTLQAYLATSRTMMDLALNRPEEAVRLMPEFHLSLIHI